MKINSATPTDDKFKPVAVTIEFETEEELKMIDDMLSWNVSIPEIVGGQDLKYRDKLKKLMNEIRAGIIHVNTRVNGH